MFRMSRECAIQPCDYRKKDKRFSYFAVDSFSIYVIRSQHKQYWGYASSGMCRRVTRSVVLKMSGPTHPLTQHHLLDSSAIPLSQPQILRQYCLHKYSGKYETGVNFNFCTAVRNDHADHKMCVSNTVPSALHIVIIKPTVCDSFSCFCWYGWHSCLQAYRDSIKVYSSAAGVLLVTTCLSKVHRSL